MEPIVIFTENFKADVQSVGHLVVGQDRKLMIEDNRPAIWISFGERCWFLGQKGTEKLRDFCNAVLNETEKVVDISQGPALDAKAENPNV